MIIGGDCFTKIIFSADTLWKGQKPLSFVEVLTPFCIFNTVFVIFQSLREIFVHKRRVEEQKNDPDFTERIVDGEDIEIKDFVRKIFFYILFQGSVVSLMFIGPEPAYFNDNKKGQFSILWLITLLACLL